MFNSVNETIAYADVKKSKAKCAVLYKYTKPNFCENGMFIKQLRHPIIEHLDNDISYDPCDVEFSNEKCGMLLYGVNGSGKSTFSKSIALCVIMAQSGHYVAAENFTYKPYERLYTRLGDADNIYKGQSSFMVEMTELKSILHYANKNSLIIGDEPCRGTEGDSALAIVSFTLDYLLRKNSTFVFATHLHQLTDISCIQSHEKLMIKHVEVTYNESNVLIYTHKIKDGKCKQNYGLEIAQKVLQLDTFDEKTNEIFNEITGKKSAKKSRYNNNVIVSKCEICGCTKQLETHHIIFQKDFSATDLHKNFRSNLVVLCEKHHNMVHDHKLYINGWKQSIEGKILDYTIV